MSWETRLGSQETLETVEDTVEVLQDSQPPHIFINSEFHV